jgi:hypothetical protein
MDSKKNEKKRKKYMCLFCDYDTCKKTDYNRHLVTDKHKINENDSKMVVNDSEKTTKNENLFKCECGKIYKYDSGYYRHKKKCTKEKINNNDNDTTNLNNTPANLITTELILELIKDNKDMKQIIADLVIDQNNTINTLIKNGITNTNSHNINCNNKTFNLQVFLNETCKDAMNITDFIDSIKLELSDLMKVGEVGYVEGISNIITSNLKALDISKRPVHCTDKKRETIYIKDQDKWEKDEDKTKIKKLINRVSHKNIRLITDYREKYPECKKLESKISDKYNKMIIEAMGGFGDNNREKEEKIIKNISKCTTIDKYSD